MTDRTPDFRPFEPSPEAALGGDLMRLHAGWAEVGIDPDDFLKCGECHRWTRELVPSDDEIVDGVLLPGISDNECCDCESS